jgi:hypothetical protein
MAERFIGQHTSIGPAPENGQRTRPSAPGVDVGQESGGENQQNVPASRPGSDISTERRER